jgi:hypothetical protein
MIRMTAIAIVLALVTGAQAQQPSRQVRNPPLPAAAGAPVAAQAPQPQISLVDQLLKEKVGELGFESVQWQALASAYAAQAEQSTKENQALRAEKARAESDLEALRRQLADATARLAVTAPQNSSPE